MFCPDKIGLTKQGDHISGLLLILCGAWVELILIGFMKKLTLHMKMPYIRGPYKRTALYFINNFDFKLSALSLILTFRL